MDVELNHRTGQIGFSRPCNSKSKSHVTTKAMVSGALHFWQSLQKHIWRFSPRKAKSGDGTQWKNTEPPLSIGQNCSLMPIYPVNDKLSQTFFLRKISSTKALLVEHLLNITFFFINDSLTSGALLLLSSAALLLVRRRTLVLTLGLRETLCARPGFKSPLHQGWKRFYFVFTLFYFVGSGSLTSRMENDLLCWRSDEVAALATASPWSKRVRDGEDRGDQKES